MPSTISAGTTAGTAIAIAGDTTGNLAFQTNGTTTAMTIDTSQNVGIGTSSPTSFSGYTVVDAYNGTTGAFFLVRNPTKTGQFTVDTNGVRIGSRTNDFLALTTNDTERMRITSGGEVGIATTSPATYGQLAVRAGVNGTYFGITANSTLSVSDATNSTLAVLHNNSNSGTSFIGTDAGGRLQLFCSSTAAGGVYLANGGTSWTSASDERVKENLEPIQNGLEKVTSLRAVTGNFINDENKKSRAFLIAQDVEAVLPEAVDSSNPDELGLAYTDVIPLLVASIKELKAELDATKAEVQALKGVK